MELLISYCSKCGRHLDENNTRVNKQGKKMKTCTKHIKKPNLPKLDLWNNLILEIESWSKSGETKPLDIKYTFDLDRLPIIFEQPLEVNDVNFYEFNSLNKAIGQLFNLIQKAGGHRFRQARIIKSHTPTYVYYCCQDSARYDKSEKPCERERRRMERFPCHGRLEARIDFLNRRLILSLRHAYHAPYVNIRLSEAALEFISERCVGRTPAEIYQQLQASNIPDKELVTQHQIYYQWKCANSGI